MLRITVDDNRQAITLQLEGKLAGPWLEVLEECWKTPWPNSVNRSPVDLTGVTFIDDEGKVCLAAMFRQGAKSLPPTALQKPFCPRFSASVCSDGLPIRLPDADGL